MATKHKAKRVLDQATLSATVTRPANTTAYTARDALSDATNDEMFVFDFTDKAIRGSLTGEIMGLRLLSSGNQATKPALDLFFFSQKPATTADNAELEFSDAELANCTDIIQISTSDYFQGTDTSGADGNIIAIKKNLNSLLKLGIGSIFCQAMVTNAYTPLSGEVFTLILDVRYD